MYELFLVEQGVEIDVEADMDEVVRILDREVSNFGTDTRRFKLEVGKATLGREWQMVVRPLDTLSGRPLNDSLGFVTVTKVDDNTIQVRIPPKAEWEPSPFDEEGRLFTSFILQLVEAFRQLGWISLPGPLPDAWRDPQGVVQTD
jgi:hypothetical protein